MAKSRKRSLAARRAAKAGKIGVPKGIVRKGKAKGTWKVEGESKIYRSKRAAIKRARQKQFFKNLESSRGGKGSLKAKIRKKSLT